MHSSNSIVSWRLLSRSRSVAAGVGLAAVTIILSELLPPSLSSDLHAMILVFIAAAYVGFASMDGGRREMLTEFAAIALFCGVAVLGLWVWPPLLIAGYAGHAVWDTLHHPIRDFGAEIVGWYIPFCVVYDLLIAAYQLLTGGDVDVLQVGVMRDDPYRYA